MKVIVTTILVQELEVPDEATRYDVLDFLGEYQSFRTAFQGVTDGFFTITDLEVADEQVAQMGDEVFED